MKYGCSYFSNALNPADLRLVVRRTIWMIKEKKVKFNFIAFSGASGAMVAPIVALRMNKPCTIIRKDHESSHGLKRVTGEISGPYIIIDDFVATGNTVNRIIRELNFAYGDNPEPPSPNPMAVFCYSDYNRINSRVTKDRVLKDGDRVIPVYI